VPTAAPTTIPTNYPSLKPVTMSPTSGNNICGERYTQCGGKDGRKDGGKDWEGPTCCEVGSVCDRESEWYSQCKPGPRNADCRADWANCGGKNWDGPTCCQAGYYCNYQNEWYSQCQPGKGGPSGMYYFIDTLMNECCDNGRYCNYHIHY
jgi:hypothetical protein